MMVFVRKVRGLRYGNEDIFINVCNISEISQSVNMAATNPNGLILFSISNIIGRQNIYSQVAL